MTFFSLPTTGRTRRQARGVPAGFTLVELLAVIAIISLVAGMVIGISGIAAGKADEARARTKIENIARALEEYRLENNAYLDADEGHADPDDLKLMEVTDADFKKLTNYVAGVEADFTDPWGKPFEYRRISKFTYEILSGGKDGKPETEHDNISNRKDL